MATVDNASFSVIRDIDVSVIVAACLSVNVCVGGFVCVVIIRVFTFRAALPRPLIPKIVRWTYIYTCSFMIKRKLSNRAVWYTFLLIDVSS
ncbi:MAG: hypothetical protein QF535_09690, partial [Anaerolineales bacterium]|nr:hypothetical protein [Anaerolineales bacterium]